MKYKGVEVGVPTLEMVQEQINRMGFGFSASELYKHYQSMNWLTKKGQAVKTLESACNVANSVFVQRDSFSVSERKGDNISKSDSNLRVVHDYFESKANLLIRCLETLKSANPPLFAEVYCELAELGFVDKLVSSI